MDKDDKAVPEKTLKQKIQEGEAEALKQAIAAATPHDWIEDFRFENGNYSHQCVSCGQPFNGHKRRGPVCKLCSPKAPEASKG